MSISKKNNRILSVDLARGFAIFFMIAVHTLEVFGSKIVIASPFGEIIEFLGGPAAAPVFMTLMGFSFIYSKKITFQKRIVRGIKIILLGYLLNLLRGVIPYKLAQIFRPDIIRDVPSEIANWSSFFFIVDILQFAGIALIIMAIIEKIRINKYWVLASSFVILMTSPFLWGCKTGVLILDKLLDLFIGDIPVSYSFFDNAVSFPVFPWLSFPLFGMFMGKTVKASQNNLKMIRNFGLAGIAVLFIGIVISLQDIDFQFNDYYHSRQGAMIFMIGFVMFWIYINQLFVKYIPDNIIFRILYKWSKYVTNIYFIQWILIIWSITFYSINSFSYFEICFAIILFSIITHFFNDLIIALKREKNFKKMKRTDA